MSSARFSRIKAAAALAAAALVGFEAASGYGLPRTTWAQSTHAAAQAPPSVASKSLDNFSQAFEYAAEAVRPAVVSIQARHAPAATTRQRREMPNLPPEMQPFMRQFEMPDPGPTTAGGSGFIVSADGYIITNNHVIDGADKITVRLVDNRVFDAKLVGTDPTTDVAVLKIDARDLPVAALGQDSTARIGEWVVAIGDPLDLGTTVTAGIVSAKSRQLRGLVDTRDNPYAVMDYIQTDAAINPGNSGGPLVDLTGHVIGINAAIASSSGRYEGYGFAVPISLAKRVMDDVIQYGGVRRAVLGVVIDSVGPADAKAAGMKEVRGAKVDGFNPADDSPAQRAGMEVGDVIIAVDGMAVDNVPMLQRSIREYTPGQTIKLDVMRDGERKTIAVKLGEPPKSVAKAVSE